MHLQLFPYSDFLIFTAVSISMTIVKSIVPSSLLIRLLLKVKMDHRYFYCAVFATSCQRLN